MVDMTTVVKYIRLVLPWIQTSQERKVVCFRVFGRSNWCGFDGQRAEWASSAPHEATTRTSLSGKSYLYAPHCSSTDSKGVEAAIDQMQEVGFEMIIFPLARDFKLRAVTQVISQR